MTTTTERQEIWREPERTGIVRFELDGEAQQRRRLAILAWLQLSSGKLSEVTR